MYCKHGIMHMCLIHMRVVTGSHPTRSIFFVLTTFDNHSFCHILNYAKGEGGRDELEVDSTTSATNP